MQNGRDCIRSHALVALLASFVVAGALAESPEPAKVRITTWNLEWFPNGSAHDATPEEQAQRTAAAADVLRPINPDIILLQDKQPNTKIEVNTTAQAGTVVVTDEQRAKLIEKLRRIQEAGTTPTAYLVKATQNEHRTPDSQPGIAAKSQGDGRVNTPNEKAKETLG